MGLWRLRWSRKGALEMLEGQLADADEGTVWVLGWLTLAKFARRAKSWSWIWKNGR